MGKADDVWAVVGHLIPDRDRMLAARKLVALFPLDESREGGSLLNDAGWVWDSYQDKGVYTPLPVNSPINMLAGRLLHLNLCRGCNRTGAACDNCKRKQ